MLGKKEYIPSPSEIEFAMEEMNRYKSSNIDQNPAEMIQEGGITLPCEVQTFINSVLKNHDLLITNKSFENVAQFKYLRTTVTYKNCVHKEMKSRLILGNACYHSVQSLLSSRFLAKSLNNKI